MPLVIFTALLLLSSTTQADAQPPREVPVELPRLTSAVAVDGVMDDEAWRTIYPLPLTMYVPVFRGEATQRTEIRVGYDDESFYAGGWFYDADPRGIRVNSLYRDRWNGDDAFAIYVDAFNDNQNAKWFGVNPAGMRFDLLVSDDGQTLNDNWDGFWTAATAVTAEGWFVEVRIPFSSIGFQVDAEGRAVMGLTVTRLVSRLGERVTFPAIDPKFPFRQPSMAQDVVLRGVRTRRPLYLTPYALTGADRRVADAPASPSRYDVNQPRELGLDLRYPLSGHLTLDVTANTDFAQVEADEQQVALDRFSLFYPERRRFFQEGAGLFDFVAAHGARLFHSRRIGLDANLQPVRILGGARIVGRIGSWDTGGLNMQTEAADGAPGQNFGVLRLRRRVLNPSSTAGLMLTTVAGGGRHNVALGADASLRVRGDEYVGLKWAATLDGEEPDAIAVGQRSLVDVTWQRRTGRGLSYSWQFTRAGEHYRPELGFMPRRDFTTANVVANWFIFTDEHRYFRRVYPGALAFSTLRNAGGALESGQYAFWVQWDSKAGGGGWVEPKWFRENVLVPFTIGGTVNIPAGAYDFADLQVVHTMPSGARLRTDVDFRAGTYFDGRRTQVIVSPTWNLSRHLELGAGYQLTRLRFDRRGEAADIHLLRARVRAALDVRVSGNAFIQYNSTTNRLDFNVRFRYAVADGTDLWIVYNENLDTDAAPGRAELPPAPRSLSRALIVKYSHTFVF